MPGLKDQIQDALDEDRILILGSQVLVGFLLRAGFEPRIDELSGPSRAVVLFTACLMIATMALLIAPVTYHRLVARGADTPGLKHFIGRCLRIALFCFVVSVALDIGLAAHLTVSDTILPTALVVVLAAVGAGHLLWLEWTAHRATKLNGQREAFMSATSRWEVEEVPLKDRIRQVLTEARVILPGAQALLGFSLATVLLQAFTSIPMIDRLIHLTSLLCIAVSTMLLMAPAAYHRIVLHGSDTEEFHHYAGRMLVAALVPLGLGIVGELYVVVHKVTGSASAGVALALLCGAVISGLWFGPALLHRPGPVSRTLPTHGRGPAWIRRPMRPA